MHLKHYNLSIPAESKEEALEKLEKNLEEEDMELSKIKTSPSLTELEYNKKKAKLRFTLSDSDLLWNSLELVFSATEKDRNTAKRIYETLNGSLEEQAVSFKPDDRGRITLGSNYSDKDEVQVIILND